MPSRLPLVDAHEKEHTYCTFCPKLCRHACPVSTVEARETTTPWGKMAALHHVAEGNLAHEPDVAATWWACTGCMRCKTFCDHDNEVASALGAGRAEALAAGQAPDSMVQLRDEHEGRMARVRSRAEVLFGGRGKKPGARVAYAPGCTGCMATPDDAEAGLVAVETLMGSDARVLAGRCCGLPLLDAGDRQGFLRAASAFLRAAGSVEKIVFSDPGCQHALAKTVPALTGEEHRGPELVHLSELAAENLSSLGALEVEEDVRYHDPCRLGRGLGVYDAPRAVLARILGRPPKELHQSREHAECSGAGGQLPRTAPKTASAIAVERAADLALAGGGVVVSPCPASRRAFEKAGTKTFGFAELVARAVGNLPG